MNQKKEAALRALKIGAACNVIYLINYIFRNLLSVYTPGMLENGFFTKDTAALFSSVYMLCYAAGQLFLGVLGDYVKPKFMVAAGLAVAGTGLALFPLTASKAAGVAAFSMLGIGLSALRGPMVKVISENMEPKHARLSCVFLSVVSYLGPLGAGLLGLFLSWRAAFLASAVTAGLLGVFAFAALGRFEKDGLTAPVKDKEPLSWRSVVSVFRLENFVPYLLIGMIAEIMASSVGFWIPTCLTERLGFTPEASGMLYSVISAVKAVCPFLCLLLLKLFRDNDMKLVFTSYFVTGVVFFLMRFMLSSWAAVAMFVPAQILSSVAGATLWSVYIPSLGKSGRASSGNGIIDCSGYFAAAGANLLFASVMDKTGWNGVFYAWAGFAFLGALIALVSLTRKKRAVSVA